MVTSVGEPEPTVALVRAEPAGAEALVTAAPSEFWALAEAVAPLALVELAVAEGEPVVLDAAALELAVPLAPP